MKTGQKKEGGFELGQEYKADEAAAFYNREYPFLFRYAYYLTKDKEISQDLCQEVFMRWFNLENAHEVQNSRAWLKKVLSNQTFNYFRHQKLRSGIEVKMFKKMPEGYVTMDADLIRLEVQEVLALLPWKDQMIIKMRMAGMSYAEIAEAMEVSIGSVGTMLARAMKKFKRLYEEKEVEQDEMPGRRSTLTVSGERT